MATATTSSTAEPFPVCCCCCCWLHLWCMEAAQPIINKQKSQEEGLVCTSNTIKRMATTTNARCALR
uniref:Putative secreted protein n=1 Tax=Anopheles darlingi TaxID=43151 RepID=A0A2M4DFI3_ANODA